MSLSTLPLGYCTNVHPGRSVADVLAGLDRYTVPAMRTVGRPLAAGLWFARPVVDELLADPDGLVRFADQLASRGLTCYTLNAFPYGDFHAARVKENVYLPDWSDRLRMLYSLACATILFDLLPEGGEGSISTLPLGFKGFPQPDSFSVLAIEHLIELAIYLDKLDQIMGRTVRLAIEPEPFCHLETTAEAVAFFERLWSTAGRYEEFVRDHIGLCYDVCHQAVEFEDITDSVRSLDRAGVRINKVQISCAVQLDHPAANRAGLEALRHYVEPRYLHQTFARRPDGTVSRAVDLTESLIDSPPREFADAERWRVHFHVPVDAETLGPLGTTKPAVAEALAAIAKLDYAPHLEVETYTWDVLPGAAATDLVAGLSRELQATEYLIEQKRIPLRD